MALFTICFKPEIYNLFIVVFVAYIIEYHNLQMKIIKKNINKNNKIKKARFV